MAVCGSDNAEVVLDVHGVHALIARHRGGRSLLSHVPVSDGLIPRPGDDHGVAVTLEEADGAHGLVVGSNDGVLL